MQLPEYGLPRIHLLGARVNKGNRKGRVIYPALNIEFLAILGACLLLKV
jgi:hypothetical protein